MTTVCMDYYGMSEMGLVRRRNEDRWSAVPERKFFALADGMGGHLGGDIAAEETVTLLSAYVRDEFLQPPHSPEIAMSRLRRGIDFANEAVYVYSRSDRNLRGMGSTLTCLLIVGKEIVYAHVGDSRIYRLRRGSLKRLTSDHSLVTELLASGHITQEDAERFIYRHVITRAIGTRARVEPDLAHEPLEVGDLYLMCSDGLTDLVRDHEIANLLQEGNSLEVRAQALKEVVFQRGATDNLTLVLVKIHAI